MKHIKLLLVATLILITGLCVVVLHKLDVAIQPLAIPYDKNAPYQTAHPVVLIAYGDGDETYIKNQNALHASAINRGIDTMHMYKRSHIDPDFYAQHHAILTQRRGAGYWLWKPYFIARTMAQYPDDTIIIYADSGVVFTQDLTPLLKQIDTHPRIYVGHGKPVFLSRHTKKEAWDAIVPRDIQEPVLNQQNIWAFFMIIKNTPENRAYIQQWLDVCIKRKYITDLPLNPDDQAADFDYHQHDQSLLSLIDGMYRVQQPNMPQTLIIPKDILRKKYGVYNC